MRPGELSSRGLRVGPILLAGVACGFDAANRMVHYGPLSAAPLDEVAHLATAALGLLVLARFVDLPRRFYVAALVASVAIDLDHIPDYLGLLGDQNGRPFTHSLATVAVFAGAAAVSRRHRAVLAGIVDRAAAPFRPGHHGGPTGRAGAVADSGTAWTASYWWYLGMIILFAGARLVLVGVAAPHARWRPLRSRPDPGLADTAVVTEVEQDPGACRGWFRDRGLRS